MQQQLVKIGARSTCTTCGKAIVYAASGWMHVRRPDQPHLGVPATAQAAIVGDPLAKVLERIAYLEAMVEAQAARIRTLCAENEKLAEKVKR